MNPNDRLKQIRLFIKYTQKEMAEKIGIPFRTLQNYEANKREISSKAISLMYTHLSINPIWILTGEGEMFYNTTSCGSKTDINHNVVVDSFCEGVRMLTRIYDKNRNLFETVMKYLRSAVGKIDIEEELNDSDKKQ